MEYQEDYRINCVETYYPSQGHKSKSLVSCMTITISNLAITAFAVAIACEMSVAEVYGLSAYLSESATGQPCIATRAVLNTVML